MAKYINVLTHKDGNKLGKRKYIINLIKWCKKANTVIIRNRKYFIYF